MTASRVIWGIESKATKCGGNRAYYINVKLAKFRIKSRKWTDFFVQSLNECRIGLKVRFWENIWL
jgi:hypothetical protein